MDVLQQLEKIFKENVIDSNTISASLVCESKMEYGVSKKVESVLLRITINFRMKDEQS